MNQTNYRTRVKICGLTKLHEIHAAVAHGADAIGLVFFPGSKRAIDVDAAAELRRAIPAFVNVVALFVNADSDFVQSVIDKVQPEVLQFHGDESPEECHQYGRRYIKAFRVGGSILGAPQGIVEACMPYSRASGWLFDSDSAGYGGSGLSFDPGLLSGVQALDQHPALVLAGGLKPHTVAESIRAVHPFAVDVSSGVELEPGIKSTEKIAAFLKAVRDADASGGQPMQAK